ERANILFEEFYLISQFLKCSVEHLLFFFHGCVLSPELFNPRLEFSHLLSRKTQLSLRCIPVLQYSANFTTKFVDFIHPQRELQLERISCDLRRIKFEIEVGDGLRISLLQ